MSNASSDLGIGQSESDLHEKKGKAKGKGVKQSDENKVIARWDDKKHYIWIQICLEEARDGNKKSATLGTKGYDNLMRKFEEQTGCRYTRAQFKNHWDNTRKDWENWNLLNKQTGIGFDGEVVAQDDDWWKLFAKANPGVEKFKDGHVLRHVDLLDILFKGNAAVGDYVAAPSTISKSRTSINETLDKDVEVQSISKEKMASSQDQPSKRKKTTKEDIKEERLNVLMDAITTKVDLMKELNNERKQKEEMFSFENCQRLLSETRIDRYYMEYLNAKSMFTKASVREMFVKMENADERARWVLYCAGKMPM